MERGEAKGKEKDMEMEDEVLSGDEPAAALGSLVKVGFHTSPSV